jgi:putative membrane protein
MNTYLNQSPTNLILRDHLAIERTALANERTLLSYVRTTLAMMTVGGTLIKFFDETLLVVSGWMLLLFALAIALVGFMRYIKIYAYMYQLTSKVKHDLKNDWFHRALWFTLERLHLARISFE